MQETTLVCSCFDVCLLMPLISGLAKSLKLAMLFGLATLSLTKVCLRKFGVVQRRMLRSIVGWVLVHDDQSPRDIMVQINHRISQNGDCRHVDRNRRVGK